jgi:hypothetical protein
MVRSRKAVLAELSRPRKTATIILLLILVIFAVHGFLLDAMRYQSPVLDLARGLSSLLCIFVFAYWIREAYEALDICRVEDLSWGPGWALGGWFIPFGNAVIPFLITAEVWKASAPEGGGLRSWRDARFPVLVLVWWVILFIDVFVSLLRIPLTGKEYALYYSPVATGIFGVVWFIFRLPYFALWIWIVIRMNQQLDRKLALVPLQWLTGKKGRG